MAERIELITGKDRTCATWGIEGALRMLHNNVVQAAKPDELIIYGGGKAARNWACFHAIEEALRALGPQETLLIQSGKPVGVLRTFEHSPRILIVNSVIVPRWDTDETFRNLEALGLAMYGQMTAGSWSFIGQQGIMQGTHETFAAAGAGPGKLVVSGGSGNMGGAQAPAAKMCGAVVLIAEVDPAKISRCASEGWYDKTFGTVAEAIQCALESRDKGEAVAIAVNANIVHLLQELERRELVPDTMTDQTAAHDPLNGYVPHTLDFPAALELRRSDPSRYVALSKRAMCDHVELLLRFQGQGATVFDYGNGIRFHALDEGCADAFKIKGFVPLYIRPLFCQGRGPFRVVALSGDSQDIEVIDNIILHLFSGNRMLCNWIRKVQGAIDFRKQPGLPARVCWLGMGERGLAVEAIWQAVLDQRISAPVWVGRDHLDCGSVASPGRETEGMVDGSDAIGDWPVLNALTSAISGADWVSFHDGGGVGHGKSLHAGQCFIVTGEPENLERANRLFNNDPALGILRHADAGYPAAIETARQHGLRIPTQTR